MEGAEGPPYGNAFSADERWLVYVTDHGQIALIDVQQWKLVQRLKLDNTSFNTVSFSPDSKSFVTGDDEGRVRLWSINPLREGALISRHASRIKSVRFRQTAARLRRQAMIETSICGTYRDDV